MHGFIGEFFGTMVLILLEAPGCLCLVIVLNKTSIWETKWLVVYLEASWEA